ncbi:MAG: hypothetical protein FWC50_02640 [Planctomycetaceae bacterium]|nr:hypothetical protein [Planctomycetaceae bacterium]
MTTEVNTECIQDLIIQGTKEAIDLELQRLREEDKHDGKSTDDHSQWLRYFSGGVVMAILYALLPMIQNMLTWQVVKIPVFSVFLPAIISGTCYFFCVAACYGTGWRRIVALFFSIIAGAVLLYYGLYYFIDRTV